MHVLLPIKNLNFAKQRLANLLLATERRELVQAMLKDVLEVLHTHPLIDDVTLVTDDETAWSIALGYQCDFVSQSSLNSHGLSDTVKAGSRFLAERKVQEIMVMHGDLPLISADEISQLITTHRQASTPSISLTPDRHGTGTNCIICNTDIDFTFHYGENSFDKHRAQALLQGITPQLVKQAGISCDIDYAEDLLQFLTQAKTNNAPFTQQFLRDNNLVERLLDQPLQDTIGTPYNSAAGATSSTANVIKFAVKQNQKNYAS